MTKLPVAVEIAELVTEASEHHTSLNVENEAARLVQEHPDADVTVPEVTDVLHEESAAAGLPK